MFDIWVGDINLTLLVLVFSIIIVFPVQLLLCFRAKSRWFRVAPVLLVTALASSVACHDGSQYRLGRRCVSFTGDLCSLCTAYMWNCLGRLGGRESHEKAYKC